MAKILREEELPHFHSVRDTRNRLDLITGNVAVGAQRVAADRVIFHPGDTSAEHAHPDAHNLFYILSGQGVIYVDQQPHRFSAGDAIVVHPGEYHRFHNDTQENFSFVEIWAPPPTQATVWAVPEDR